MNDEELDAANAERVKAYEAGIRLPGEFKERFVGSVRRRRVWRRVWMLGLFCAMAAAEMERIAAAKAAAAEARQLKIVHGILLAEVIVPSWCISKRRHAFF